MLLSVNPFLAVGGSIASYTEALTCQPGMVEDLELASRTCLAAALRSQGALTGSDQQYVDWLVQIRQFSANLANRVHPLQIQLNHVVQESDIAQHADLWTVLATSLAGEADMISCRALTNYGSSLVN